MNKLVLIFIVLSFSDCFFNKNQNTRGIEISKFEFESIFGTQISDPEFIYSVLGSGYFRTPRSNNSDSLLLSWLNEHPNAIVYPVTSTGPAMIENPNSKFIFSWVIENQDTLNNFLIKNGCYPGGTMGRSKTIEEMEDWEKELFDSDEDDFQVKHFQSTESYNEFFKQILRAEEYARSNKLGLWSED